MRILDAVSLERSKVIGIPKLFSQFLEYGPVPFLRPSSEGRRQMLSKIGGHPVIVEEGIIDVE